jgi:hypothetical protein
LPEIGDVERCAQLRSLASLAGSGNPLVAALRRAEQHNSVRAYVLLDALPSIPKRRLLATYRAVNNAGRGR